MIRPISIAAVPKVNKDQQLHRVIQLVDCSNRATVGCCECGWKKNSGKGLVSVFRESTWVMEPITGPPGDNILTIDIARASRSPNRGAGDVSGSRLSRLAPSLARYLLAFRTTKGRLSLIAILLLTGAALLAPVIFSQGSTSRPAFAAAGLAGPSVRGTG